MENVLSRLRSPINLTRVVPPAPARAATPRRPAVLPAVRALPPRPERGEGDPALGSSWRIRHAPGMDALDLVVSRAATDPRFRRRLLAEPVAALALAAIPLALKRRLVAIRARDLGDFALQALEAQAALARRPS